ncbi:hypothetical protein Pcinc_004773 [Petrolisthes cinctipes]|uniref:Sorting nexin-19 n=1 Tax=Petrolisthes cinctipes TaxID=88211 RepID=A0AAE1GE37_PETCI|nr:hypothetical protein Pcinc_004773 [Petrolisthes cinctipes]
MSRWLRGAIWGAGSCVVWCPVCVCLSGGGAWWVCACAVGLITITLGSGYTTWTLFNNLLCHGPHSYPLFAKCFKLLERIVERGQTPSAGPHDSPRSRKSSIGKLACSGRLTTSTSSELLLQEVMVSAGSLHSFLILPWYSHVSPDAHFSYQIKDVLEEILTSMCRKVKESGNITQLASGVIQLYLQHYRQYQRAVKKASKKHKDIHSSRKASSQEIQAKYKPLHPALKNPEALKLYYCKLAQILLQHYLPVEVTSCDLLLISLRDLFAQNVLQAFVDLLCDTQWLNTRLSEILSGVNENATDWEEPQRHNQPKEENTQNTKSLDSVKNTLPVLVEEKLIHPNLPSIEEETLFDLQQLDPASPQHAQSSQPTLLRDSQEKQGEKKFENAEELVEYVRSSSLEKKESSEDEDYRSVSSALGTFISTTAGPLLPDASSPPYHPMVTKMWESPLEDKCFVDIPPVRKKKNPFMRNVIEGMKEEEYKIMYHTTKDDKSKTSPTSPAAVAECSLVQKLDECMNKVEIRVEDIENGKSHSKSTLITTIGDIMRSKSCENLVVDESIGINSLKCESKSLHSSLCKLDQLEDQKTWSEDSSNVVNGDEVVSRKEKGHLVKMLSFDKNDGTDQDSLVNNAIPNDYSEGENIPKGNQCKTAEKNQMQEINSLGPKNSEESQLAPSPIIENTPESEPPNTLDIPGSPPLGNAAGFGWENPDLSPIYEESEDLASSIAKLRSLLTERESQHSLGSLSSYGSSESEPKSAQSDPGRYNLEKSRFTFTHKDSSGSLASVKSVSSLESCGTGNGVTDEEPLEAAEVPLDGRVFLSVSVPVTEVHTELGGTQYTLYTIQYDAIYLCESPTAASSISSGDGVSGGGGAGGAGGGSEESTSEPVPPTEPRMVLQTNCVKRRFREFLRLHSSLEEDPKLRTAMKGVKGPNKWLNLPFSKLDSTTIATRKQFLEKYLQSVIQRPEVNISTPVKEFLAYGLDSSVSFVKKPLELQVPRLDKLLAKTVSGVFHSLKTALPSFELSDSQGGGAEGQVGGSGGGGVSTSDKTRLGGGAPNEQRTKLSAFLSTTSKGEYELKLDITAEEEDCQIEEALMQEVSVGRYQEENVDTAYEAKEKTSHLAPVTYSQLRAQYQRQQLQHQQQQQQQEEEKQYQQQQQLHQHSVVLGWGGDSASGGGGGAAGQYPCLPPPGPRLRGDGCDDEDLSRRSSNQDSLNGEEGIGSWEDSPLSIGLLDVVVEVLAPSDHPLTRQPCVTLLSLAFASITHKWIQTELERVFSENNSVEYIQLLREAILTPPQHDHSPPPTPEEVYQSRARLHAALIDCLPGVMEAGVGRVVDSLQHPSINADLALHLLDLIAARLLPVSPSTP